MEHKLKIEDFFEDEIVSQDVELTKLQKNEENFVAKKITEEINHFINNKEHRYEILDQNDDFFNIIPKTKLELAINKAINKPIETKEEKNRRLIFKSNFDMKRRKINRIKSKSYRKAKRNQKKEQNVGDEEKLNIDTSFIEQEDVEELDEIDDKSDAPVFSFNNAINNQQQEIVKNVFSENLEENEEEFAKEKIETINNEVPKTIETILPGWGDWAGPGLEIKKTQFNTIVENKFGIDCTKRKDFGSSHVIINQKSDDIEDKYKTNLPYGYNKEEYMSKLNMPISKELNTARVYKKILNTVTQNKRGQHIEPFHYKPENF